MSGAARSASPSFSRSAPTDASVASLSSSRALRSSLSEGRGRPSVRSCRMTSVHARLHTFSTSRSSRLRCVSVGPARGPGSAPVADALGSVPVADTRTRYATAGRPRNRHPACPSRVSPLEVARILGQQRMFPEVGDFSGGGIQARTHCPATQSCQRRRQLLSGRCCSVPPGGISSGIVAALYWRIRSKRAGIAGAVPTNLTLGRIPRPSCRADAGSSNPGTCLRGFLASRGLSAAI
jgi:hypothetical protein